ncbi:restriction endonuclease subunit S [Micromonospora zamorensis]|uniref:restriction endonuclease subunit S n=1 Tax=Micromonospora zamorensis TaxID=709883 RepID=UPI002E1DD369
MTDLPDGWTQVTLGDVALSVKNGIFISRPGAEPNGVAILRISAVRPGSLQLDDVRYTGMDRDSLAQSDALLTSGDLLFTRYNGNIDYVGACAVVPAALTGITYPDKLIRVRIDPVVADSAYVGYIFESPQVRSFVRSVARTTAGQAGISGSSLKSVPIPLPPLAEQRRIVAALDEHLSRLAAAESQVVRAAERVVDLDRAFAQVVEKEIAAAPEIVLEKLLSEPLRNGHSAPASQEGEVRTISLTAVTQGEFSERFSKMTNADAGRVRDLWLKPGDILIQRSNTPELVGTAALYRGPDSWAVFPDLLIRVRLREGVETGYVLLMLQSPRARRYFTSKAKGLAGSMPKIDQKTIREFSLRLPELEKQKEVVRRAGSVQGYLGRLESTSRAALKRVAQLRTSLLAEAYAGRLVQQDPYDEPASELLARVQAQRAAAPPKRKTRSRRTQKELAAPPTRVTGDDYQQEALPL